MTRIGNQQPTDLRLPADVSDTKIGDAAIEFAESLGYQLHPWQEYVIRLFLSRCDQYVNAIEKGKVGTRRVQLWSARDCVLEMPRQNGKNVVLEVIELTLIFLCDVKLIRHSAHRAETAHQHFRNLKEIIESNKDLMDAMPTHRRNNGFTSANGKEAIELANGNRIVFFTRAIGGGRGPAPEVVVFDEAYWLFAEAVGTLAPSTSAQPNPLLIFTSSAPRAEIKSRVLHGLKKRAFNPENDEDRFAYVGWCADAEADPDDRDVWYKTNPSLGLTKHEQSMEADRKLMEEMPGEFEAEHCGIAQEELAEQTIIALDKWDALADTDAEIVSKPSIGLEVSQDRNWSTFGVAGRRPDSLAHVEIPTRDGRRPGTGWVIARGWELHERWKINIRIVEGSPAWALVVQDNNKDYWLGDPDLHDNVAPVTRVSEAEFAQATGNLIDWACGTPPDEDGNGGIDPTLTHSGSRSLRSALAGGVLTKTTTGAVKWSRVRSVGDPSPLCAVTVALGGIPKPAARKKKPKVLVR